VRTLVFTLIVAVACGLIALTVCVSIPPLSDWTQELGSCRGYDRVERDVRSGGDVQTRGPGNSTSTVGTTVFTLRCTKGDEVKLVENDEAVLRGFAVAFLIGAIPGAALYLGRKLTRRPA
jgi:hypothetical protein